MHIGAKIDTGLFRLLRRHVVNRAPSIALAGANISLGVGVIREHRQARSR